MGHMTYKSRQIAVEKYQKVSFAYPSSSPRSAKFCLLNPTIGTEFPDGCQAFPMLEQVYNLCGGGWMGIAGL